MVHFGIFQSTSLLAACMLFAVLPVGCLLIILVKEVNRRVNKQQE
jgi:hypothetical protein